MTLRYRITAVVQGDEVVIDDLDQTAALQLLIEYKRLHKPVTCTPYFPGKR